MNVLLSRILVFLFFLYIFVVVAVVLFKTVFFVVLHNTLYTVYLIKTRQALIWLAFRCLHIVFIAISLIICIIWMYKCIFCRQFYFKHARSHLHISLYACHGFLFFFFNFQLIYFNIVYKYNLPSFVLVLDNFFAFILFSFFFNSSFPSYVTIASMHREFYCFHSQCSECCVIRAMQINIFSEGWYLTIRYILISIKTFSQQHFSSSRNNKKKYVWKEIYFSCRLIYMNLYILYAFIVHWYMEAAIDKQSFWYQWCKFCFVGVVVVSFLFLFPLCYTHSTIILCGIPFNIAWESYSYHIQLVQAIFISDI